MLQYSTFATVVPVRLNLAVWFVVYLVIVIGFTAVPIAINLFTFKIALLEKFPVYPLYKIYGFKIYLRLAQSSIPAPL